MQLKMYASGGCSPTIQSAKCNSTLTAYVEAVQQGTEISVIAFRWDQNFDNEEYLSEVDKIIMLAQANSKKVIVMAQPPLLNFSPSKVANCDRLGISCPKPADPVNDLYPGYNDAVKQRVTALGAEFYDPYTSITDVSQLYEGDKLLYSDTDHLSVYGGRWLYEQASGQTSTLLKY